MHVFLRRLFLVLFVAGMFLLGWFSNSAFSELSKAQFPLSSAAPEKPSPSDWIKPEQIHVFQDKVVIDVENPSWAMFTDTNSMDPVFDAEANTIEITPKDPTQIKIGDIISYKSELCDCIVVHRVIGKGVDEKGFYFIVKGDNNPVKDPEKVRFEQIVGVVVGVIY
ncbi:signal peptidase I [Candidatus Woesearchaeota archaeon]|nr:signal peptidase I [Candidatus Woesearchaeota archaeon]RLE40581.1 MAG: signal peptidase I [Candidatus Woesearchaeota archaeon]